MRWARSPPAVPRLGTAGPHLRALPGPAGYAPGRFQIPSAPGPAGARSGAGPARCRAGFVPGRLDAGLRIPPGRMPPDSDSPVFSRSRARPQATRPAPPITRRGGRITDACRRRPLGRSEATCKETFLLRRHAEERRGKMAAKAIEVTAESPRPLQRTAERLPLVGGGGASPSVGAERLPLSSVSLSSVSLSSTRTAPVVVRVEHPAAPAPRPRRRRALHQEPTSTLDRPTGPRNGRGTGV